MRFTPASPSWINTSQPDLQDNALFVIIHNKEELFLKYVFSPHSVTYLSKIQWQNNSMEGSVAPANTCQYYKQVKNNSHYITKTRLYNFDPLKPHFYIVKLAFTGVYIIFLILLKNIDCGYSLELPRWGSSNKYPQSMFWAGTWKISEFFIWKFSLFWL